MTSKSIQNARIAAGLSQTELAETAGVSRSLVAFAERGLMTGADSTAKIERALNAALKRAEKQAARAREKLSRGPKAEPVEAAPAA